MHLIVQTYSLIELQQLRSELEQRGIKVHVSDEFTYAIPGMPGAEQPRGLWVALEEDIAPARRVVSDLAGEERLEPFGDGTAIETPVSGTASASPPASQRGRAGQSGKWLWPALVAIGGALWILCADS